jgi:ABC-2 type transport system permease protein
MKAFMIFLGKEMREHIRSNKLWILGAVFIFFGILSPATARFMPDILKLMGNSSGVVVTLPPVSVTDSYAQFFKNMSGVGVIIVLLVFAGSVSGEKAKGSASLILTKNLSKTSYLLSKYTGAALLWTCIYAAGALVCFGYTLWLFPGESAGNVLASFAAFWLYGLLLLAFTLLASAAAGGFGLSALGAFAGWGVLMISMAPQKIAKYTPAALGAVNVQLIRGDVPVGNLLIPALIAVALSCLALCCGACILSRQEL